VLSDDDIRSRLLAVVDATTFMDVLFSTDPPPSACA
jgi:hypothetical protein